VRDEYDIIGLDPRGVGQSSPVQCDPDIFNERFPTLFYGNNLGGSSNSSVRYQNLVNHNRRLGESCANLTGPLLDHLDTAHVAKDHELVRQALGADKFNYFGLSYGSLMGQQYLTLFPNSVGRMALDGLIDHSQSEVSTLLTESTTYEATLNKFFQWCDTNSTCALYQGKSKGGRRSNDTKTMFEALLAKADMAAIPAPSCNGSCQPNATGEDIRYNVQNFLDFVDLPVAPNWIDLGSAIAEAMNGNATALSTPLATSETSASIMGSPFSYLAIGCQDWLRRANSVLDLTQRLRAVRPFAPITAGASQTYYYQSACIDWPANVTDGQAPLNTSRFGSAPPPVLLSNSAYDPSCSIVWADGLREQLPGAVSIMRNGSGHTSHFLVGGETRDAIDNYLATGKLPMDGMIYQT
jgi:pimeloyl-ACP methyl ester carboxylesterase